VGNVAGVSELHAVSVFRVEVRYVGEFLCVYRILFRNATREGERRSGDRCQRGINIYIETHKTTPFNPEDGGMI
jgi:hypothetical protein